VLPLIIAVAIAHLFTVLVLKRSILTEKVARRGFHISREYAVDELEVLFARDAMRADIIVLPADETVAHARELSEGARDERSQHLYPVVDEDANLVGAIAFADLHGATPDQRLGELAQEVPTIFSSETLRTATQRMAANGATRLIVVNPADRRKVVGKLALHDVLAARLKNLQEETRRERVLPVEYLLPKWLRPWSR
jgi:CBS domain-containing protein